MGHMATLQEQIKDRFGKEVRNIALAQGELTLEVERDAWVSVAKALRDEAVFQFETLIDLCGVDYSEYGATQWQTFESTRTGFCRGVEASADEQTVFWDKPRFAVVVHLLSLQHNQRLRLRTFVDEGLPMLDTLIDVWDAANWYEREAFDLFGILFEGHPDLRRLLVDYGFVGHPFRKDFPLIGHVEMRYDAREERVVYEPVSIKPRTLVPKVIRHDNRYQEDASKDTEGSP